MKSPPELWAEVSDPETLARHLGEFGEIRITRTHPEKIVAWEGERASGTVEIEASGWGTRVILTAEGRPPAPAPRAEPPPAPGGEWRTTREPLLPRFAAPQRGPEPTAAPAPAPAPPPAAPIVQTPPDPPAVPLRPIGPSPWERRRSFLSRVFPRRPGPVAETPPEPPLTPVPAPEPPPEPSAPDPPAPEPLRPPQPEVPPEPAATLSLPEPRREPEPQPQPASPPPDTLRVLESVLDDLGAAHHRPFSRG